MKKNRQLWLSCLFLILLLIGGILCYRYIDIKQKEMAEMTRQLKIADIKKHYHSKAIISNDTSLYALKDKKYEQIGKIYKNTKVKLGANEVNTEKDEYFKLIDSDYYVKYMDIENNKDQSIINDRYLKYIPFDKKIVTNSPTTFYREDKTEEMSINQEFTLEYIIKEDNRYGVIYNNELLYIDISNVKELIDNDEKYEKNTKGVSVIAYHFFADNSKGERCDQDICLYKSVFSKQMHYLKDNNFFTLKLSELELYLKGEINIPKKSVVITIDDGAKNTNIAIEVLNELQLNATMFLITSWNSPSDYIKSDYIEYHSHSDNLHQNYMCSGGAQGGYILCIDYDNLIRDLTTSKNALKTTYFCYPFYDYNERAIKALKEVGYTMAFIGGNIKAKVGVNLYKVPRYVIRQGVNDNTFTNWVN